MAHLPHRISYNLLRYTTFRRWNLVSLSSAPLPFDGMDSIWHLTSKEQRMNGVKIAKWRHLKNYLSQVKKVRSNEVPCTLYHVLSAVTGIGDVPVNSSCIYGAYVLLWGNGQFYK
jgi:hypothetical protein